MTPDKIEKSHPAIKQVYWFGVSSLSPDSFEALEKSLLEICDRHEEKTANKSDAAE